MVQLRRVRNFKLVFHLWSGEQTLNRRRVSLEHLPPARGVRLHAMESPMSTFDAPETPTIYFHVRDMTSERSADAVMGALMQGADPLQPPEE